MRDKRKREGEKGGVGKKKGGKCKRREERRGEEKGGGERKAPASGIHALLNNMFTGNCSLCT